MCLAEGRCVARGGQCVVGTTAHCRASRGCEEYGLCVAEDGRCVGSDDAGCAKSLLCKRDGLCSGGESHCVARGDDCKASAVCKELGRCQAAHDDCFVAADAKGCRGFHGARGKTPCFDFGECKEEGGVCVAEELTRCAVSTMCKFTTCVVQDHRCRESEPAGVTRIGNERWVTDAFSCWFACVNDRKDSLDAAYHCGVRVPHYGICHGVDAKLCKVFKDKPDPPAKDPPEPWRPH